MAGFGGAVKLIVNLVLVPMTSVNIYGAPIGSVLCQGIACMITFIVVKRNLPVKLSLNKYLLKPLLSAGGMGVCVYLVSRGLSPLVGNAVSTLLSIGVGLVVYAVLVFVVFKVFDYEEIKQLPMGRKIIKLTKITPR